MNGSELAILSLIAEKPRHGYEIELVIEQRGMREWTEIGFSTIYYLLKKLESKNLIAGKQRRKAGKPARKVYKITDQGQQELIHGALQLFHTPAQSPNPLLIGFSILPMLDHRMVLEHTRHYHANLLKKQSELTAKREAQRPLLPHVVLMFDYSLTMIEAEIGWISSLIDAYDSALNNLPGSQQEQKLKLSGEKNDRKD